MRVFIDTSAFYAILDANDKNHKYANSKWISSLETDVSFITTNYILLEAFALIQRKLGMSAASTFHNEFVPIVDVSWIDIEEHQIGAAACLETSRKKLSLVDCISFNFMRSLGIKTAFAFDKHFNQKGFDTL